MIKRRIKFIWGGAETIKGHWHWGLFGFYSRAEGKRDDGIAVSVRGVMRLLAVAAAVAYLAGTTVVFWLWEKNPYNLLTYSDALLLPLRRAEISAKRGRALNAQGMDLWRDKKYQDAAFTLRQGLTRFPRDWTARLTLARYYLMARQRTTALTILQETLDADYPGRAYVRAMLDTSQTPPQ